MFMVNNFFRGVEVGDGFLRTYLGHTKTCLLLYTKQGHCKLEMLKQHDVDN